VVLLAIESEEFSIGKHAVTLYKRSC
jgi:hypothetical protein